MILRLRKFSVFDFSNKHRGEDEQQEFNTVQNSNF